MNILLVAGAYAPNRIGGPAVIAERLAAGLAAAGHRVTVLTGVPDSAVRYEVAGLPVVGVPESAAERLSADLLEVLRPDVVHMHSPRMLGPGALAAAQRRRIATVASIYTAEPALAPELLAAADAVVVDDPQGYHGQNVRVIANGVPPAPAGWHRKPRRGPLRLGYIGGTDPEQGYPILLQALASLRRSDYELHVVDRAAVAGVRSLRPWDFPVPGLVRLLPGVDPEAVATFYGSIDALLCLPQSPGHVALSVREAMVHGVWPVATAVPANTAVIEAGTSGDLVGVGSSGDLAAAVARLLDGPLPPGSFPVDRVPTLAQQVAALEQLYAELAR
jgi:glycosyltransferase involved in cell wall biosynthesis